MDAYTLHRGAAPLLISLPHDGTRIPEHLVTRLNPEARRVPDTDWHVARLYDFAVELGASLIVPTYSRYVVDLNRPSDNASLYPGQNTTGLCPIVAFSGEPIYQVGEEPRRDEIAVRVERYWKPYHDALATELERIHAAHRRAVLWEGHSIRGVVPFLFEGTLPDFNLGTADGTSCARALQSRLAGILAAQHAYSHVANGRFKGGFITRHYGRPDVGIDAVQLELVQANYMDEDTFEYLPERAAPVRALIRTLLETCLA